MQNVKAHPHVRPHARSYGLGILIFALGLATGLTAQTLTDSPQRAEQKRADLSGAPNMEVIASIVEIKPGLVVKAVRPESPAARADFQDGDRLIVFPTLVYGDPPRARVDGNTLVHLDGALPIRDQDSERRLTHRLREKLIPAAIAASTARMSSGRAPSVMPSRNACSAAVRSPRPSDTHTRMA